MTELITIRIQLCVARNRKDSEKSQRGEGVDCCLTKEDNYTFPCMQNICP